MPYSLLRYLRTCLTCLIVLLLFVTLCIALLCWGWRRAQAAPMPTAPAYDLVLILDQSGSMTECDGQPGSDPQLLRQAAARLLVSYLGADSNHAHYQASLLYFGGVTKTLAPLTDLASPPARDALVKLVSQAPEPIPWTNPLDALQTAHKLLLDRAQAARQRVVILLSDGQPAWEKMSDAAAKQYRQSLQDEIAAYTGDEITLFMVLLQNPANQCSAQVAKYWLALWQALADSTPQGMLYTATGPDDLLPIYHALVRQLVGATATTTLAEAAPIRADQPLEVPVPVNNALQGMVITILKQAAVTVTVTGPDGAPIVTGAPGVTLVEGEHEAIYRFDNPQLGAWTVRIVGQGAASIYQDQIPWVATPTDTPSPTASATATPPPTATPTATATATSTPTASPTATSTPTPTASATATPPPTATPTATATSTPTNSPTATSTPTATASATATPTATVAAATATQPPASVASNRPQPRRWWPLALILFTIATTGSGALLWVKQRPHLLSGELVMVRAPEQVLERPMALDLGSGQPRARHFGANAEEPAWRLPGWPGSFRLTATADGGVELLPLAGDLLINGRSAAYATSLHDGDQIQCGEYQLRYDNVRLLL